MRTILRSTAALAAIILVFVTVGGCAGTGGGSATYSFDPKFSFPESKTYQWGEPKPTYRQDSLLEANVRFLVDQELQAKGLTSQTEKAALIVWIGYESNPNVYGYAYGYGYELRALTLNVARPGSKELVWRGLATGAIKTDAASGELQKVVAGIMANFPPK